MIYSLIYLYFLLLNLNISILTKYFYKNRNEFHLIKKYKYFTRLKMKYLEIWEIVDHLLKFSTIFVKYKL